MKKLLASLLLALMLTGSARAEMAFLYKAYMGYQGEEITVRIGNDGKHLGEDMRLTDQDGNTLADFRVIKIKGFQNVTFTIPAGRAGLTMCLRTPESDEPIATALLAAATRPGYCITRVDSADKKIAITFDSANAPAKTLQILDLLDRYGAKCTFFLQGTYVKANPDIAREIMSRGHEVGNHSYSHPNMPDLTNDEILRDFQKSEAIFTEVLGAPVSAYRPPSGHSTQRDRAIARALGQEVFKWDIDSRDGFSDSTLNTVVKRVQNNAVSGSIILMHVYGKHTLDALEQLLPYYIDQGYEFVTVSTLLPEGDTFIDEDGVLHPAAAAE